MEDEKKITKIVISKEDELTDIVSAILDAQNERIILTFAEETDLLISPINLKVLLETADESEKLLIAQIIKNPTGLRNANLAEISTIDTTAYPTEENWGKEEINRAKRLSPPKKEIPLKEEPVQDTQTDFQRRVDETIERSKSYQSKKETPEDDFLISVDEDLPSREQPLEIIDEPDLSKIDFSQKTEDPIKTATKVKEKKPPSQILNNIKATILPIFEKIPRPKNFKKMTPVIIISVVALILLVGFIYINTAILVKVKIYVEAKEVTVEKIFEGDENIKEIDFEELKIPVKTDSVEKARSTNIKATGTGYRGEKATGDINITYIKEGCNEEVPSLVLPAGHTVSTTSEGQLYVYTLDSETSIKCTTLTVASITAIEAGEEYNLSSGQLFTFQGYSSNQLLALNNSGAITGGSKEEYTILSKADVDAAVEELTQIATEEGENELKEKSGTWDIINDSLESEVIPGDTKTSVAIGSEASDVTVSIKTKSTASYFLNQGFDEGIEEILTNEAKEQNLFETDKDWNLELDEDIEKEITIAQNNADGIKIKLVATSAVKPEVNKEDILKELKDKNWEEGQKYLETLDFSEKKIRIEFLPENFPDSLKYFPKRQGGVLIDIADAI
jgi:hypothetical protein